MGHFSGSGLGSSGRRSKASRLPRLVPGWLRESWVPRRVGLGGLFRHRKWWCRGVCEPFVVAVGGLACMPAF